MAATKKLVLFLGVFALVFVLGLAFYLPQVVKKKGSKITKEIKVPGKMQISSTAFGNKEEIPKKYTCQGINTSPPLVIEDVPEQTQSLVLIVDDPDAPLATFTHWLVFNLDPKIKEIKEGELPAGALQGTNDFGQVFYGGPCPPSGRHRYFFRLYALDSILSVKEGTGRAELEKEMADHIIESTEFFGTYQKI
jgi:hypothetical protein